MLISPISNSMKPNSQNFKAAYPVYHWLSETNGSYAITTTKELSKTLQSKLVRMLNKYTPNFIEESDIIPQRISNFMAKADRDFGKCPIARSFYNHAGGWIKGKFEPLAYLITGEDAELFEKNLGKPIGIIKRQSPVVAGKYLSAELNLAIGDYKKRGLMFVKERSKNFHNENKIPYGLHIKYETARTKNGKIKGFDIVGLKFLPEKGESNPFVKLGMVKE